MFCARCWSPVGAHDRTCAACEADLTASGSVRMTDPRRVAGPDDHPEVIVPIAGAGAGAAGDTAETIGDAAGAAIELSEEADDLGNDAVASADGDTDHTSVGTGSDPSDRGDDSEGDASNQPVADDAADRNTQLAAEPQQGETADSDVALGETESVGEPAEDKNFGPETETPATAAETEPESEDSAAESSEVTSDKPESHGPGWWGPTKARLAELGAKAAAFNEPAVEEEIKSGDGFNFWSELGVFEPSPEEAEAREYAPKRQKAFYWLLGGIGFVVIVSILITIGMLSSERKLVRAQNSALPSVSESASPSSTTEPAPAESEAPAETASATPTSTPTPKALKTPSQMVPGHKQCADGLWSGPQTSCNLAQAVAEQVDKGIKDAVEIQAFSTTTNRNYRLQCTPGEGITCTGLDGVSGVVVYLATP